MKKLFTLLLSIATFSIFAQSPNIAFVKKSKEPIIISTEETLNMGDELQLGIGQQPNGDFKYIKLLNAFKEPVQDGHSTLNNTSHEIYYFKEVHDVFYVYTKYLLIEIESAIAENEVITKHSSYINLPKAKLNRWYILLQTSFLLQKWC